MLGIYEYILLKKNERADLLWKEGEFLANVKSDMEGWNLYCLYDFYVEVTLENDAIVDVTPFKAGERLDKYLNQITLD